MGSGLVLLLLLVALLGIGTKMDVVSPTVSIFSNAIDRIIDTNVICSGSLCCVYFILINCFLRFVFSIQEL